MVVVVYRPMRFRRVLINQFGTDDWKVPLLWIPWLITLSLLVLVNIIAVCFKRNLFVHARATGCDPHNSKTYENLDDITMEGIRFVNEF
ncbi:hypothetical protein EG68_08112 [Paragonimus skrjabini miyazakii]|uniref:Uncharacterized protein n=1 Tax=Paragonimus skrjabini miyazakii TaxID=59628 RepID=A0A8S9YKA2_9TREM|nr:hypothetical protein EG68_08112 [Paragonimus skrjabini miyazakii]